MNIRKTIFLILNSGFYFFTSTTLGADPIPDDVRYMIEDIYGIDKHQWPKTIYSKAAA